ncbi:hypothetical protein J2T57_004308 [Natronocella acetinitrilica]|uniref:Fibronectin type-III domain-containing protein n=2 Tax=Natronocella acetinitrilica TaxID=414046 RepID=A0AAE3KDR3_9GAMM|nr:hypothetical protein [Natronocella acetinitrilica]
MPKNIHSQWRHSARTLMITALAATMLALGGCISGGGGGSSGSRSSDNNTVDFGGNESVTLSWSAPSARENGDPISLSEIEAYELYVGQQSGNYSDVIRIGDNGNNSYTLRNLAVGTYYVAMRTADINGLWSRLSTEIELNIQ